MKMQKILSLTIVFAILAWTMSLTMARATPAIPCGMPEYSRPGQQVCKGSNSPAAILAAKKLNWDGCNGRDYDECNRHVWVHYNYWRAPPAGLR